MNDMENNGAMNPGAGFAADGEQDPSRPAAFWFQDTLEGRALFAVFYSQACRWSRCLGCNLPSVMSGDHVPFDLLMEQVDYLFSHPRVLAQRSSLQKMIISNNGSVFDEATFSSTALMYLVAKANMNLPNLATLTMETRPEYVDIEELKFLSRALKEGARPTGLELAVGFEAFDGRIRNQVFNKGMGLGVFENMVALLAEHKFSLKCYFMLKPVPDMSDEAAVEDIHKAIDYLSGLSESHGIGINMHLNPTYAARGTALEESFLQGRYIPPSLKDLARAALHAEGRSVSIYLGLSDEGLACQGGSFIRPGDEGALQLLETFNRTLSFDSLRKVIEQ